MIERTSYYDSKAHYIKIAVKMCPKCPKNCLENCHIIHHKKLPHKLAKKLKFGHSERNTKFEKNLPMSKLYHTNGPINHSKNYQGLPNFSAQ